ncbi:hypothetical protein FA13DRAFT_1755856 [Coprinellus micaceus]|uniref:Alpha/beta-hydrolase n=1 Tax=Coprinellus micaceus TaxID=71717 RepID=A0A4Y7T2G3_COPMI|nr:hypothetical protein FA13DRAFT_1755856 [Coprinellus micaceus]
MSRFPAKFGRVTIIGDLKPGTRPLVALHGGPGVSHDYLEILADSPEDALVPSSSTTRLATPNRHISRQDGRRGVLEPSQPSWVSKSMIFLGHSWGGMFAAEVAIRQPPGLKKLVIVSSPASMALLPKDIQKVLDKFEDGSTPQSTRRPFNFATLATLCLIDPMPGAARQRFRMDRKGPNCVSNDLDAINVPTLITNGDHDEAADSVLAPFVERIAGAKWVKFQVRRYR